MAKRPPAIQTRQGHPQGIVDDVLIPIARRVIRSTAKTGAKAYKKEKKLVGLRHETLLNKRRSVEASKAPRAVTRARAKSVESKLKSSRKNIREFNSGYRTSGSESGLLEGNRFPVGRAKSGVKPTRSKLKKDYPYTTGTRSDKKAVRGMRKDSRAAYKLRKKEFYN